MLGSAQETARRTYQEYEGCVRESPGSSMLCAVAAGYFLRLLPIGAILSAFARIVGALVKPAVLLFGASKVFELLNRPDPPPPV